MSEPSEKYAWKEIPGSSHDVLRRRIRALPARLRLLDLGAAGGHLGRAVRDRCSYLAGVEPDETQPPAARGAYDDWRATGVLGAGEWDAPFDVAVCADVLEHVARPAEALERVRGYLRPGGLLLASLPNVANVSVRLSLLFGRFRYADRGILDGTHLSFFTRRSGRELLEGAGFRVRAIEATAMPYELAVRLLARSPWRSPARAFASVTARAWPTMFGYQFVYEAVKE